MRALLLATPLVALVLSACGADAEPAPEVASLPSSSAATSASSSASSPPSASTSNEPADAPRADTGTRPQFRVDDTDDRRQQIWDTYTACLTENGAPATQDAVSSSPVDMDRVPEAALAACADLEPVQPPALDGATNPDFQDDLQAYVRCMQDDGLHVTLYGAADEINWTYTEGHPVPEDSDQIERRCLVEGFGAG